MRGRSVACAAAAAVSLIVPLAASSATAPAGPLRSDQRAPSNLTRPQSSVQLGDGRLRAAVERLGSGRGAPAGLTTRGDKVLVEVLLSGSASDARQTVAGFGGDVVGQVGNSLLEAYVPYGRLVALEHSPGVRSLRPPLDANVPVATNAVRSPLALIQGDEVLKTNAAAWQAAGITGAGVKVGIVDYYDQAKWTAAQAAGEVPAPAGTFCRSHAADCTATMFGAGSAHGVAVAEVIHEMAPSAQIYLASADSVADLQDAVNWFASQGVTIVSRSLTANFDNPGDGTGPLDAVVANAVSQGMTWFNSAGNNGGGNGYVGSYWRGAWVDANHNDVLDFAPGDEALGFVCGFINGFRWSDWVPNKTDYDTYVYSDAALTQLDSYSIRDQSIPGVDPIEYPTCSHPGQTEYLVVQKFAENGGNGPAGDVLEFMTNGTGLEYWQDPYSAAAPAVDFNSPGALAVGAVDPASGTTIAPYSSQGPTNDNRIKPDLSAASCVSSFTLAPNCFNGTSAAAPAAAGAAALVRSAGLAATPAQIKIWLLANAIVDRGAAGADNVYGAGELVLPAPPQPATVPGAPTSVTAVAGDASATVSWTAPADGGSAITGYVITPYIGPDAQAATQVGKVGSTQITGLANGTRYTFTVRAVNGVGTGPESAASNAVTPEPPATINWAAQDSTDFDGDHITDLGALYRGRSPQDSLWFAQSSAGGSPFQIFFGATTDIPVPGDYNGDGKTDAVIFRPSTGLWYGPQTGAARIVIQMNLGQAGDIPIPGDYDGDGKTDPAIYRPSTGLFFAVLSGGGTKSSTFGAPGDVPVPRDYDGDGKTDFAIYRQDATPQHLGLWYAPLSGGGVYQIYFGAPGDIPVPGDYNGDKRAEAVIFRSQANALWYGPYNGAPGLFQLNLGTTGDTPIPGYYDNNLSMDPAIYRKSTGFWFALKSGGGTAQLNGLGLSTDVPVEKRPALAGGM